MLCCLVYYPCQEIGFKRSIIGKSTHTIYPTIVICHIVVKCTFFGIISRKRVCLASNFERTNHTVEITRESCDALQTLTLSSRWCHKTILQIQEVFRNYCKCLHRTFIAFAYKSICRQDVKVKNYPYNIFIPGYIWQQQQFFTRTYIVLAHSWSGIEMQHYQHTSPNLSNVERLPSGALNSSKSIGLNA